MGQRTKNPGTQGFTSKLSSIPVFLHYSDTVVFRPLGSQHDVDQEKLFKTEGQV